MTTGTAMAFALMIAGAGLICCCGVFLLSLCIDERERNGRNRP
jgi:hypothetical protein